MIYESDEDRLAEKICAWVFERRGFEAKLSETRTAWDIALKKDGVPHALVEYKCREEQFDPYYIDASKIDTLIAISNRHNVSPWLVVEWPCGYWVWEAEAGCQTKRFRRKKRRGIAGETQDSSDIVYCIPLKAFRKIP